MQRIVLIHSFFCMVHTKIGFVWAWWLLKWPPLPRAYDRSCLVLLFILPFLLLIDLGPRVCRAYSLLEALYHLQESSNCRSSNFQSSARAYLVRYQVPYLLVGYIALPRYHIISQQGPTCVLLGPIWYQVPCRVWYNLIPTTPVYVGSTPIFLARSESA